MSLSPTRSTSFGVFGVSFRGGAGGGVGGGVGEGIGGSTAGAGVAGTVGFSGVEMLHGALAVSACRGHIANSSRDYSSLLHRCAS